MNDIHSYGITQLDKTVEEWIRKADLQRFVKNYTDSDRGKAKNFDDLVYILLHGIK